MNNFYYEDEFCSDIDDFLQLLTCEPEELPDDYSVSVEMSELQPMIEEISPISIERMVESLMDWYVERMGDGETDYSDKIESAFTQSFDVEKFKSLLPKLYYPNGTFETITKSDLIEYSK